MVENHKENLRYKYRKKGLNEQQVESKLQRRLKTEKTLLKTAAVVGTAAAAYALKNKVQDDFIGRTIKKGKTFDSVSGADKIDKSRPVYGAFNKLDKLKYRGLYGTERKMRYGQTLAKPAAALAAVTAYKQHKKNTQTRQKDEKYNNKYNRRD